MEEFSEEGRSLNFCDGVIGGSMFSYHESPARTTFEKLCQRPIEMEEFSEEGHSLNFRVTLFVLDVKKSYREG